jgi:predicted PhzF superfamily epimerase YddE/YHI9
MGGVRTLRYFQVEGFTSELFNGNPAGVCVLEGHAVRYSSRQLHV